MTWHSGSEIQMTGGAPLLYGNQIIKSSAFVVDGRRAGIYDGNQAQIVVNGGQGYMM